MKIRYLALLLPLLPVGALAQSTASQVLPGFLATDSTNCPSINMRPCYVPYSSTNPLPVTGGGSGGSTIVSPSAVTPTDRGGTLTTGGTAQTAAVLNASRKAMVIQNPCNSTVQGISTAEDLFVSITGSATTSGAGDYAELTPCMSATVTYNSTAQTTLVSVIAATTGHRWLATEAQ